MRNFKKTVLLLLLVVLFEQALSFALEPVTFQHYLELELKQKEAENVQPDMVFIGNSRVSSTFIPSVFTENMEEVDCAFNAGTGSQGIAGTYYYLKDILKQYDLQYVVMGLDYQTVLKEDSVLKRELVVLERIKSPVIKAEYIADVFEPSEYIYFLKSYQYRNQTGEILTNLKQKLSREYRQGIYTGEGMVYEDLGFTRETEAFGNEAGIYYAQAWAEEKVDRKKMEYLDKIIALCEENDTQLYLVSTPLTISTVYGTSGYGECCQFFKDYAQEKGIPYDNLNLLRGREEFLPDAKMSSMEHVGGDGAEIISEYYCEILKKRMANEEVNDWFYSSVDEMKENMSDVAACSLHTEKIDEEGNRKITGESLHKENVQVEYQFEMITNDTVVILQEYGLQEECLLPLKDMEFPMTLRVRCRSVYTPETEKIFEICIDETTWKE